MKPITIKFTPAQQKQIDLLSLKRDKAETALRGIQAQIDSIINYALRGHCDPEHSRYKDWKLDAKMDSIIFSPPKLDNG